MKSFKKQGNQKISIKQISGLKSKNTALISQFKAGGLKLEHTTVHMLSSTSKHSRNIVIEQEEWNAIHGLNHSKDIINFRTKMRQSPHISQPEAQISTEKIDRRQDLV